MLSRRKKKILVIDNSVDVTGAIKSILRVADDMRTHYDFHFIIPKKSKVKGLIERYDFNQIHEFPIRELKRDIISILLYIPFLFINAFKLRYLIQKEAISLVHVNDIYNLLPAINKLFGGQRPYVCHVRLMSNKFPNWLFRIWIKIQFRAADKIIAVSEIVLNQLPSSDKLMKIYDPLPKESDLTKLLNEVKPSFVFIGNFIKGKGQDFAIEAFAKIHMRLPEWRLRLVGSTMGLKKNAQYKNALISRSKQLNVYDKIDWIGFTNEVETEYSRAEIVLNFSESESFSLTCLEALFFGRPLIATDCGGPFEILSGEEIGILVPNRDISSMAINMEWLAKDPGKRERLGVKAKKSVRERFQKEKTSMKLKEVYDNLISQ